MLSLPLLMTGSLRNAPPPPPPLLREVEYSKDNSSYLPSGYSRQASKSLGILSLKSIFIRIELTLIP